MESMRWGIRLRHIGLHKIETYAREIKMIQELLTDMEVRKLRSKLRTAKIPGEEKKQTNEMEAILKR